VNSNARALSGVASFSISMVPGTMRLRTVQLAYSPGRSVPVVSSGVRSRITRRRVIPGALTVHSASTNS
jgi:hypothetical protein